MLAVCQRNQVAYRYVLADSWFSAKENLHFIRQTLGKHFVIALKSNRTVALSDEAKRQGTFSRLDALNLPQRQAVRGYLRGLDFAVLLVRQVFTNKACPVLDTGMAAAVFCIWLAATSRVTEKALSQSTRNGGAWRLFTRRSRAMRR